MKWIKPLCNMVIPAILFNVVYNRIGIIPAVIISLGYSLGSVIYAKLRDNAVKNSQIIGILGLVVSAVMIAFTGEEKLYYVPALIENFIFLVFMIVLLVRRKSVLHFLAKDFEVQSLMRIPEENMLSVNVVWVVFFVLKILSKLAGIFYMDFNTLYWVVFLLGDPMTILVVILSVILIRTNYRRGSEGENSNVL